MNIGHIFSLLLFLHSIKCGLGLRALSWLWFEFDPTCFWVQSQKFFIIRFFILSIWFSILPKIFSKYFGKLKSFVSIFKKIWNCRLTPDPGKVYYRLQFASHLYDPLGQLVFAVLEYCINVVSLYLIVLLPQNILSCQSLTKKNWNYVLILLAYPNISA